MDYPEQPLARVELSISQNNFNSDTIMNWSQLQENLQLQYSILQKENETKNERVLNLISTLTQYHKTLLRYKDLRFNRHCSMTMSFGDSDLHLKNLIDLVLKNSQLFASIIHSSLDYNVSGVDDFIFDLFTFLYDPIAGAGMGEGVFGFMNELLQLEIKNLRTPNELFDKNNLVCKFLLGYTKGPSAQAYLQSILGPALNLLINVKESLETNPRNIYEQLQNGRDLKENKTIKNTDEKKRKNIIQKIQELILGNAEQDQSQELTIYDNNIQRSNITSIQLDTIIKQINPAIQSYCQTPLGRIVDSQLLEQTARILHDRKQATELIINTICHNICNSLNKIPFVIRILTQLMLQLIKTQFPYLTQSDLNQFLSHYLINRWIVSEFTQMYINNCPQETNQLALANVGIISKLLVGIWKGESQDLQINITQSQISRYFQELVQLPSTQLNYYINDRKEKHLVSFVLSLQDVQILVTTINKSKIEGSLNSSQLLPYKDLKKLSETLHELLKQDNFKKSHPHNHHFARNTLADIYQINYIDTAFKFTDQQKIKQLPKLQQEEQLFIGKAKQVVAQFLISIERISYLRKLRDNVILTFDNLIYMYKDSYENKGMTIKQYENISSQLYANYLLSIYNMIPEQYTSNNLDLLCQEMKEEFDKRVAIANQQQQTMLAVYLRVITQLQAERSQIKAHNKILKKQEMYRELNIFFKTLKMPVSIQFNKGSVSLSPLKESIKYKTLDPRESEKQAFLTMLNSSDPKTVIIEIAFQTIRDFIDIIAGMKIFNMALEGDELSQELIKSLYDQYIALLEQKMQTKQFFQGDRQGSSEKTKERIEFYNQLCYQWLEKSIVRRIMLKQQFTIEVDQAFHELCLKKQRMTLQEHGIGDCEGEYAVLMKMSDQIKQLDTCVTHLEKLECIQDCQNTILNFIQISGLGSNNEGQDSILPIFIYLVVQAAPRYMNKNIQYCLKLISLIRIFLNEGRWQKLNNSYNYANTQLITAFGALQ